MSNTLEIEVVGPHNENLFFRPLGRTVRGRFDLNLVKEPLARMKVVDWPQPIPGQRIGVDPVAGEGYIAEPLHDDEHRAARERIAARGQSLPPAREAFPAVDVATWLWWLKTAVERGLARIVKGELPATIKGPVQRSFLLAAPRETREDKLVTALERQNQLIEKLLTRFAQG
jgi:hypothetical protein